MMDLGAQLPTFLTPSVVTGSLDDYGRGIKAYFSNHHEWVAGAVFGAFTLANSLRVLAYVPQMLKFAQDENGASAVSYSTWTLFLISHLTTIAYALVCPGDLVMAFIFLANAFACLAIIAITFVKRRRYAARLRAAE
jgi:Flp pilus assembly pilin Flp